MSKTLWHTIKIEVPKEMINLTKKDKVVVKKSLTKTNNISKSNKEPSIKIIPGDTNKPKIISGGKEWNVEELKLRMKKAKELGKKNEGKELKKQIPKDEASNLITKEIIFSNLKKKSKEDLLKLYRRAVIILNPMLNKNGEINKQFTDLSKDELLTKINNLKKRFTNKLAIQLFNTSNIFTANERMEYLNKSSKEHLETMKQYRKEQAKENKILKILADEKLPLDFLQVLAQKVLHNRFAGANKSYIDMDRYSRETMKNLIKDFYKQKPKIMEYIIKSTDKEDPQKIKYMFAQARKK